MGWWIGTVIFAGFYVLVAGLVQLLGRKGENTLKHLMVGTSVFCCWYMWSIMWWAQMYPFIRPVLKLPEHEDEHEEEAHA
eukprot:jgi/Ulvmu1/9000/UM005_0091.1